MTLLPTTFPVLNRTARGGAAAIAALTLLAVAGCATPTYVPPTSGPMASVIFTSPNPSINNPVLIHTPACTDKDAKLVGQLYSRGLGQTSVDRIETTVPADRTLSVSMLVGDIAPKGALPPMPETADGNHSWEKRWCRAIVDFVPRAGEKYRVTFATDLRRCLYAVERAEMRGGAETWRIDPSAKVRDNCALPGYWSP